MTETHRIRFTQKAWVEFDQILDYIERQSPQNAKSVRHELLKAMGDLYRCPIDSKRWARVARPRLLFTP